MHPAELAEPTVSTAGLLDTFLEARPALLRFLTLRGAAPDEAEDILQEVSLKLSAETAGPIAEPRAYLYRMATNHSLDHRRNAGRHTRREEDWVDAQGGEVRERDEQPSPEAHLIAREQLVLVQRALDALPERTRTIFRRYRVEKEPQRLIAEDLGISLSAVEKHLTRAYEAIAAARRRLDGDLGGPRRLMSKGIRNEGGRDGA